MTEKYNQTIIILAFCSAFTDFLTNTPADAFYPRDRIIHTIISALIFMFVAYIINSINFERAVLQHISIIIFIIRLVFISYKFSSYFRMFYGNSTVGIVLFTIIVFIMVIGMNDNNISQIGGFYIIVNIIMLVLFIIFIDKADAVNIYTIDNEFNLSFEKIFVLFDVFTISVISENKMSKWKNQKKYIVLCVLAFAGIILVQGLCIKGELLYSLSPLQAVLQILSGKTVKRYDYLMNLFFIFNYFGAIVLYSTAVRKLLNAERYFEKN